MKPPAVARRMMDAGYGISTPEYYKKPTIIEKEIAMSFVNSIDALVDAIWDDCVRQRAASGDEQIERWQSDELARLHEQFLITPATEELRDIANAALGEWDRREAILLNRSGHTRDEFLTLFYQSRSAHLASKPPMNAVTLLADTKGVVNNLDWVTLFTLLLPAAIPDLRTEILERARMMVATFYLEKIAKAFLEGNADPEVFRKLEARWQLVVPTKPRGS